MRAPRSGQGVNFSTQSWREMLSPAGRRQITKDCDVSSARLDRVGQHDAPVMHQRIILRGPPAALTVNGFARLSVEVIFRRRCLKAPWILRASWPVLGERSPKLWGASTAGRWRYCSVLLLSTFDATDQSFKIPVGSECSLA